MAQGSDIEIAREAKMNPIVEVAGKVGIPAEAILNYGPYKGKLSWDFINSVQGNADGKLILVTAINPTPAGEGKTTTTVGLSDGLNRIGKKTVAALREPSLGPCFGVKGGAAGGGYAQVVPMEDINLHFTGDFHAITSANNLLSALLDNHIYWGNSLGLDPRRVAWRRVLDMNDRALRSIVNSLGGVSNGYPREDGFDITVASEVMAILCLASDLKDLERRLGNVHAGYTRERKAVTGAELKASGAMTVLLKDALQPNIVQTLENNPVLIHGGPFANIAHGCNSVLATTTALKIADYVVTEAGFGADLGAEKFFDIKCRKAGLKPSAAVIVATVRALKMHGGVAKADLGKPDPEAVRRGGVNLARHPREYRSVWRSGHRRDQQLLHRHAGRSSGDQGDRCGRRFRGRALHTLGQWFCGHRGAGAQGRRACRERQGQFRADLPGRHAAAREDRDHRQEDLPRLGHRA